MWNVSSTMKPRVPVLEYCCCGCNLKIGSATVAILNAFQGLGYLCPTVVHRDLNRRNTPDSILEVLNHTHLVLAILGAALFITAVLLFIGTFKKSPTLVLPWIICGSLYAVTILITHIFIVIAFFNGGSSTTIGVAWIITGIFVVNEGLQLYFILVVYSYYVEISEEGPRPNEESPVLPLDS